MKWGSRGVVVVVEVVVVAIRAAPEGGATDTV
jgi:hypothetical protein